MRISPDTTRLLSPFVVLLMLATLVLSACAGPAAQSTPAASTKSETKPTPAQTQGAASTSTDSKPTAAAAQVSFQGKTINLIVPYAPGGTYDLLARVVAKILPKYLPGNPGALVTNQPGGGGAIGTKAAYEAKPDGLTILHFPGGQILLQFLGQERDVDYLKFEQLGSAGGSSYVYIIRTDLGLKTVGDLRTAKQPVKMGGLGKGAQYDDITNLLTALAGLNQRLVSGYKGTPELYLAIKQKELDGVVTYSGVLQGIPAAKEQFDAGELDVISFLGGPKIGGELGKKLGNLPYIGDAMAPEDRKVFESYMNLLWASRPFAAPPGTPPATVQVLRSAFEKMFQDPEFLADAAKASIDIDPLPGDKVLQYFNDLLRLPEPTRTRLYDLLK